MEIEFSQLAKAIGTVFEHHGVPSAAAANLAQELTDATFAGYESHGIGRVRSYLIAIQAGVLHPDAKLTVVRETPSTALLDGGGGFGILMALQAAGHVADKARKTGLGAVALRNCGDVARLASYAERIANQGTIGIVAANDAGAGLVVAPHGGTRALLTTDPIAAGIPRRNAPPLVFDLATTQIALGAARAASRRGEPVQEDTLIDANGLPTRDPEALFTGLAALLPLGGMTFGFKGTALALLVETLAGGLSGDGFSGDFPDRNGRNAVFMLALRPEAFTDPDVFHAGLEGLLERIRQCPPRPGTAAVRLPGEGRPQARPGDRIEIPDGLWHELEGLMDKPGSCI
jgi:hydroxycarboxylate dehydrogenase B